MAEPEAPDRSQCPAHPPLLPVGVNGVLMLVARVALVSIWFGRSGGN